MPRCCLKANLILLLVLFYGGCTSTGNLVGKKQFNPDTLREGGVVIAGIAFNVAEQDIRRSLENAQRLEAAFRQAQPEMRLRDARTVYKVLGGSLYSQMLNSFQFHGVASAAYSDLIREGIPDVRYLVFARIQDDQTHYRHQREDVKSVRLQTVRAMTVSLLIYDLEHGRHENLVWGAALQQAASEQRRIFLQENKEIAETLYPPVPTAEAVLEKVFPDLLRYLFSNTG